jgi:hypothetical protein
MKYIPLSKGYFAKVDDWHYKELDKFKWHFDGKYARRNVYTRKGGVKKQTHILLHRLINKTPEGVITDHIDGDCLNNQESNLRNCDKKSNAANMRKHRGTSIYKGVSKYDDKWRTQIWQNNKKALGVIFQEERHAAMCYDLNASVLFREYARLNFPEAILVSLE